MLTMWGRSNWLSPSSLAHRAADVRVLDRRRGDIAGVELIGRALVVAFLVGHRADEGDVVHDLGGLVPALGDRDAGDGRLDGLGLAAVRGARLGVEGLELAGAAGHPEQDAGHLALAQVVGLKGHPVGEADGNRRRRPRPRPRGRSSGGNAGGRSRPAPFIATCTVSFSECHGDFPFSTQRRVRNSVRVDQAPVDVFERLAWLPTAVR